MWKQVQGHTVKQIAVTFQQSFLPTFLLNNI